MANFERVPGVSAVNDTLESVFPVADEYALRYKTLAGFWVAIGAWAADQTIDWAEHAMTRSHPAEVIGTLAVAAVPTGVSTFFWRRGRRSEGE